MGRGAHMKTLLIMISIFTSTSIASTLLIHDPAIASQAAYTSAEYNGPIPYWIWNGQLIDIKKANEVINNPAELICSLWMMDWTEDHSLTNENLKSALFISIDELSLWKRVSGKTIFTNPSMNAALSYVCVQKTSAGQIIEIEYIDDHIFNDVFSGVVEVQDQ